MHRGSCAHTYTCVGAAERSTLIAIHLGQPIYTRTHARTHARMRACTHACTHPGATKTCFSSASTLFHARCLASTARSLRTSTRTRASTCCTRLHAHMCACPHAETLECFSKKVRPDGFRQDTHDDGYHFFCVCMQPTLACVRACVRACAPMEGWAHSQVRREEQVMKRTRE